MKDWIILYVRHGFEYKVLRVLQERLDTKYFSPFIPCWEKFYKNRGVILNKYKLLFPGYIFLQTEIDPKNVANELRRELRDKVKCKHIYKILHYGNNQDNIVVKAEERIYWDRLLDKNFCLSGSVGFIKSDLVNIVSGPLHGLEGRIKYINRHKREAIVEIEIMEEKREIRLMLEILYKA